MQTTFNIGDTYYLPRTTPTEITVPCPTCYGARKVTMMLGNGELVNVECEGCGTGYEGPRGCVHEYTYECHAERFEIASIESMHSGQWYVKSTLGSYSEFTTLCKTPDEALIVSQTEMTRVIDQNRRNDAARTKHQRENQTWTVQYHEKCIKDFERQIVWHRAKVSERKKSA